MMEATMPTCVRCEGEHRYTFRDCPIKLALNNSIKDKILNKNTFATVTKNKFDVLSDEEFPELHGVPKRMTW